MITRRENMLRCFRCEDPQWIPVITHIDPYNQPSKEDMPPELEGLFVDVGGRDGKTIDFSRYLGCDIMDNIGAPMRMRRPNVNVETTREGDRKITVWHTPAGELREVRGLQENATYAIEHFVKGADDLPALAAAFEDTVIERDDARAEAIRRRSERIGDDGLLQCSMPGTPLGMMYRVFSGVETLAYLCVDAPAALRDLFGVMERTYRDELRQAVASDIDFVAAIDDTSTTCISPAMFEQFNMDVTDGRAEICDAAGKLYFHHSCGLIRDLLPLYRRTRMHGVHGFNPPPTGNVTIREGRDVLGDGIAIYAATGLDHPTEWNPDRIADDAERFMSELRPGDCVCLGTAAYPHLTADQTKFITRQLMARSGRGDTA